jgi:hypothetical protein
MLPTRALNTCSGGTAAAAGVSQWVSRHLGGRSVDNRAEREAAQLGSPVTAVEAASQAPQQCVPSATAMQKCIRVFVGWEGLTVALCRKPCRHSIVSLLALLLPSSSSVLLMLLLLLLLDEAPAAVLKRLTKLGLAPARALYRHCCRHNGRCGSSIGTAAWAQRCGQCCCC